MRRPVLDGRAHHAESARHRWPPVVATPRGLAPPYPCSGHHRGSRHLLHSSLPLFGPASSLLCSTPVATSPVIACCTKCLPVGTASEAGQQDSPAVVFLREHLTGGSLLRLVPHSTNPAVSSAPRRSSSPTTSPAASTTPSAPHWRLLSVVTRATAEAPPPVSTPFPASPPRFSCSGM
jgi:hypothetical protein